MRLCLHDSFFLFLRQKPQFLYCTFPKRSIFQPRVTEKGTTSLESLRLGGISLLPVLAISFHGRIKLSALPLQNLILFFFFFPDHVTVVNLQIHFSLHVWTKEKKMKKKIFFNPKYILPYPWQTDLAFSCDVSLH